jgi:small subunit ribosomal protein S17e
LGRIRQKYIKRTALELVQRYGDSLTLDFKKNREFVQQVLDLQGKMLANRIAGYVTRLLKQRHRVRE